MIGDTLKTLYSGSKDQSFSLVPVTGDVYHRTRYYFQVHYRLNILSFSSQ